MSQDKPDKPKKKKRLANPVASKTQREVEYREKQLKALELLAEGYTYTEIGKELGCSPVMVGNYVKDGLGHYKERIAESVETLVAMEWRRLEHQETKLWRLVRSAENDAFDKDGNRDYKSIATLYARLQSLNADRLKLIEKIDPGADLSLDTRVSLVVVRSRQELPKIIEATEFAQRVLHDGISAEGEEKSEADS